MGEHLPYHQICQLLTHQQSFAQLARVIVAYKQYFYARTLDLLDLFRSFFGAIIDIWVLLLWNLDYLFLHHGTYHCSLLCSIPFSIAT